MKKIIAVILFLLVLTFTLPGCINSKTEEQHISVGTYVMEESEEPVLKPRISLKDDNKFNFSYSPLSSYLCMGSYEVDNGFLILKTDDGNYKYVFEIKDKTLVFIATESSDIPSYANVVDGSVFK